MKLAIAGCMVFGWLALGAMAGGQTAPGPPASDARIVREAQAALDGACSVDGPGAVVLIAKGDTVIFRAARGRAEMELGVPLSTDDVFRIASVTKMFTAAMVLKLAEAGKLSIDDPLAKYLPDFPNAENITIRELLNHTSGVSDRAKDPMPGLSRRDVETAVLVAEIAKRPPDFAPGTRWAYSNAGFQLLGAVIEKVTGERWYAAMEKEMLQPQGLKQTRFGASAPLMPGLAAGYSTDEHTKVVTNATYISPTFPAAAGGLVSTLDDLRVWMRVLTSGRVVSKEDFTQMTAPGPDVPGTRPSYRYGFGMFLWRVRGMTVIGHTGEIDGFSSALMYMPELDVTTVVLANDDNFDAQTMGRRLTAIALGQPYAVVKAVQPSAEELQSLAGQYTWDPNTVETLSVKDGVLYAQRGKGNVLPLAMTAEKQLHFVPDELSYFVPVRDASGRVVGLDYFDKGDGPPLRMPRQ